MSDAIPREDLLTWLRDSFAQTHLAIALRPTKLFQANGKLPSPSEIRTRSRRLLVGVIAIAVALDALKIAHRRIRNTGDFDISREFGRRFITGEYLYRGGLHFPYLPTAAMFFSPLAALPASLAFAVWFSVAITSLWLTLTMLHRMISRHNPALASSALVIGAITTVLAAHYIVRDLDDGGPHTILLAIITAGVCAASRGRKYLAAICLGLAAAVKITPGLFIPFLLWKREWRLAIYTGFATVFWVTLPMIRMGAASWSRHMQDWVVSAGAFAIGRNPSAEFYYGTGRINNQSLHAACVYLLEKATGSPRLASSIAIVAAASIVVMFCWKARYRYVTTDAPAWLLESSTLLLLTLLLSPITWEQHLVLMVPALYLIVSRQFAIHKVGPATMAALTVYVLLSLVLTRDVIGKQAYDVFLAVHVQTICILIVLCAVTLIRPTEMESEVAN